MNNQKPKNNNKRAEKETNLDWLKVDCKTNNNDVQRDSKDRKSSLE